MINVREEMDGLKIEGGYYRMKRHSASEAKARRNFMEEFLEELDAVITANNDMSLIDIKKYNDLRGMTLNLIATEYRNIEEAE